MKKKQKRGITIVTLVITIIILVLLTGTVMLTMNNTDIFGQTKNTVDEHNKQAIIEQINLEIETEMIKKVNEIGRYEELSKEETINIINKYGTYEDNTLKLTTDENKLEIYLYEILNIQAEEYITAIYKDKILTITEKEESLSSNGYKYEYTYDNGIVWQTYTTATTIQEQSGIKVRIVNSEGQVISNEYVVTKGAGEETVNKIKLIAVTTAPTKTTYVQGQTFNPAGMEITVTYEDNTRKQVTNYNYTPTRALTVSDRYITISYTENGVTKQTTQSITVTNKLTAIGITELKKTKYKQGETINKSDIVVRAIYEDNTNKQVTNFTYEPTGALQASDTSITVTYTEGTETKTASKDIQVTYITALEITSEPSVEFKTTYIKGENFDPTGLIVSVIYADRNALPVTNYEIVNGTNLQVGTNEIVIRYTEGGITLEKEIPITVTNNVTGIVVTKGPDKITYNHGETFDKIGMVVTATYQDKTTRVLEESEYTVSTPTYGQNYVTITHTYTGMTTLQAVTVNRVLVSIEISKAPNTTKYIVGDKFNIEGMIVTATYNNGDTEDVTSSCTFSPTIDIGLTINDTSITITYDDKTTSQEIDVKDTLGNQITKDNYGQAVNYSVTVGTTTYSDWQIYYKGAVSGTEYIYLIKSSSIGDTALTADGDVTTANSSSVYNIMRLGNTDPYILNSSYGNSKAVATLVNGYSACANIEGYKDVSGNSYVVGAIGGPTIELVQARANTISSGAVTLTKGSYGYYVNGTYHASVSTGIPTGTFIWVASPSYSVAGDSRGLVIDARKDAVSHTFISSVLEVCPVVCLKASIPATWNETNKIWEI